MWESDKTFEEFQVLSQLVAEEQIGTLVLPDSSWSLAVGLRLAELMMMKIDTVLDCSFEGIAQPTLVLYKHWMNENQPVIDCYDIQKNHKLPHDQMLTLWYHAVTQKEVFHC